MDINKALAYLRAELAEINAAIASLEGLYKGARRRGRPPAWLAVVKKKSQGIERTRKKPTTGSR